MKGIQMTDFDLDIKVVKDRSGKILSGLTIGDILHQNQAMILNLNKGELKENPSVGVGLPDLLMNQDILALRREIQQQLEMDGQTVDAVLIKGKELIIKSHY